MKPLLLVSFSQLYQSEVHFTSLPVTTNLQSSSASCRPLLILTHNLDHFSFPFFRMSQMNMKTMCLKRKLLVDIFGYLCSQANLIDIQHETHHALCGKNNACECDLCVKCVSHAQCMRVESPVVCYSCGKLNTTHNQHGHY